LEQPRTVKGGQTLSASNVVNHLIGLSATELDEVIKRAKALKQFAPATPQLAALSNGSTKRGTDEYDWILGECANVCRAQGLSMLDVEALKASRLYKSGFRVPIVAVHAHIESFTKDRMRQRVVYRLAYKHMAERYRWGPPRMVASTALIPRMLDEMLPGYYQAGLMDVATRRLMHGQTYD